jgi:hypothetical protein
MLKSYLYKFQEDFKMRKTKIVCTIGPASESEEMLGSSWLPCEKFKRATFIPAFINFSSISSDSEAGPIVHT